MFVWRFAAWLGCEVGLSLVLFLFWEEKLKHTNCERFACMCVWFQLITHNCVCVCLFLLLTLDHLSSFVMEARTTSQLGKTAALICAKWVSLYVLYAQPTEITCCLLCGLNKKSFQLFLRVWCFSPTICYLSDGCTRIGSILVVCGCFLFLSCIVRLECVGNNGCGSTKLVAFNVKCFNWSMVHCMWMHMP